MNSNNKSWLLNLVYNLFLSTKKYIVVSGIEFLKQLDDKYFLLTKIMSSYIHNFWIYDLLVFCILFVKVH